jgi:quercetin dioxygenase-like cupin family protein
MEQDMATLTGFGSLAKIPPKEITDKISGRMMAGEQGMIVWWDMKACAHAGSHSHPNEQLVWMMKGRMELRIGGEKRMMVPGDVAVIPGGINHEAWFPEDVQVIDIFCPPREDFLAGVQPAYMKKA